MHEKIRKIIKYALPISIIITGLCFIAAALTIYFTGGDIPYTRERVGVYLLYLLIPSIPCLAMIIFEIVEAFIFIKQNDDVKGSRTAKELLSSFYLRFDLERAPKNTVAVIHKENTYRRIWHIIAISLSVVCTIGASILVMVRDYTVENLNGDVIGAIIASLPLAVLALSVWCVTIIICDKSRIRELTALKSAAKNNTTLILRNIPSVEQKSNRRAIVLTARIATLVIAVAFVVLGIINGGMADVLSKAVKICTECIGLG